MNSKTRLAFLVEDDTTFLLPAVERTIELLREGGFRATHLGVVPPKLGNHTGAGVPLWYLRVFGVHATVLLALLKALSALGRLRAHWSPERRSLSWRALGRKLGLDLRFFSDPNARDSMDFLRASECDVLFILVPYVLREDVLAIPRVGTINKHAAVLPGCRGLFPYIWGTIHGLPRGVTFHQVTVRVDRGPVLVQRRFGAGFAPRSMMEFYRIVFHLFPEMAVEAAKALLERPGGEPQPAGALNPRFGLPKRGDMKAFRAAGGRVIRAADLVPAAAHRRAEAC